MKIKWIVIGKTDDKCIGELTEKYLMRLRGFIPAELIEIPDLKKTKTMPERLRKEKEGNLILKQIKPGDYVVLLDENGRSFSSLQWSKHLEKLTARIPGNLLFVTGGAYGFSEAVYNRADEKLSLSPMTFSHQIIRPLFAEQLYRAFSIIKGHPYHNE